MTIKSLYFLVQESEGFSVKADSLLTYSGDGYAVGGSNPLAVYKCMNDDLSFRIFNREINRLQACSSPEQVIGAWVDVVEDPNGVVYIEISDVVRSKQVALELAKARGEKAIYDFANSESIYL